MCEQDDIYVSMGARLWRRWGEKRIRAGGWRVSYMGGVVVEAP